MNRGLAGFGKQGDWAVDIDEIIGTNLFGIAVRNGEILLQAAGFPLERILQFQRFVQTPGSQARFHFPEVFEGAFEAIEDEGRLVLRVTHNAVFGSNIVEIKIGSGERSSLATALAEAIEDARQLQ